MFIQNVTIHFAVIKSLNLTRFRQSDEKSVIITIPKRTQSFSQASEPTFSCSHDLKAKNLISFFNKGKVWSIVQL